MDISTRGMNAMRHVLNEFGENWTDTF